MSLLYRKLAQVEFLHDYFADGRCTALRVVPSPDTALRLAGAGIVWRMIGHKLVLLAKVDGAGKLRRPLRGGAFHFYILPSSETFFTISALGYNAGGPQRYFFSNRSGVSAGGTLALSRAIPAYNAGTAYSPGDLVLSGGSLFSAIRPSGGSKPAHAVTEVDWWMPKAAGQYANAADLLEWTGAIYAFPVSPAAASVTTAIWGENVQTGAFDVPVRAAGTVNWGEAQTTAQVSFAELPAARYRAEVNGESRTVYYDEDAVAQKVFGVIEIQPGLPESHTHGLFAADGTLRSPVFTLRFPARSLHWKYVARTADVTGIRDGNETLSARHHFDLAAPLQFLSSKPIPLREEPVATLFLKSTLLGDVAPIASASPHRLSTCTVSGDVLLCSEIRLNY